MKHNFKINLDKLEFTYSASNELKEYISNNDVIMFDEIKLIRQESRMYANEYAIWGCDYKQDKGIYNRLIGFLYYGSHNPNRQNIYISYLNECLYDNYMLASRFYVEEVVGLEFICISKIDIAIDFNFNIINRLYKLYKDSNYSLIVNRKKIENLNSTVKDVVHIAGNNSRKQPFANPTFCIHNDNNSLSLKAYNKTNEINQSSNKQYIIDNVGFNRLYRLEVSCANHKVIKKSLDMINLTDEELYSKLQDENTLISLFMNVLERLIKVQYKRKSFNILSVMLNNLE